MGQVKAIEQSSLPISKMVLKVFFLLATLVLVSLPTCSATVQQQQQAEQQCVSQADFDRMVVQMATQTAAVENLVTRIAAVETSHSIWRNATLHILRRYLPDNPALLLENIPGKLENIQSKMEQQQNRTNRLLDELATLRNTTMDTLTDLQHQIKQQQNKTDREMAALENTIMDGQDNLQEKVDTLQDKVDTVQHKIVNLEDKLDTLQYTTEASTRKNHHEVVALLHNTSCSLDGAEELQIKLENVTEGLQGQLQLQSCNGTDISIQYPPNSCREIAQLNPHSPPGYYKINTTSGAVQVYCDIGRHCCGSTGGWMRAAYLNMTDPTHYCPTGFRLTSHSKRSCERITRPGCTGLTFAVQGIKYSKVCGMVIGYQNGTPNAFQPYYYNPALTLDRTYVNGVSITHGHPRRHIWTFAAALDEVRADRNTCPCTKTDITYSGIVPPFVGSDYFCDTGSRNLYRYIFYPNDPLWDGRGCGPTSSCCHFNTPPWFCKELPQPTTDDIQVRVCTDQPSNNEDIAIEQIQLYLQ